MADNAKHNRAIPRIAGIGEILWDVFPDAKRLGGAPANFSYIAHALGAEAYPVSVVGSDANGLEIRSTLGKLKLPDRYIQEHPDHETGRVDVKVSAGGLPSYTILEPAAWDFMEATEDLLRLASGVDAVCFGTLAQRNAVSREAVRTFLEHAATARIRLLDINLRLHYYTADIVDRSIRLCNWLKLNGDELIEVTGLMGFSGSVDNRISQLYSRYRLDLIALTLGSEGSRLITAETDHRLTAEPLRIRDTVGAGDAFAATLVTAALAGLPLPDCHQKAAQVSAFLCRRSGATPFIPAQYRLF